jgi:hypothetical protein
MTETIPVSRVPTNCRTRELQKTNGKAVEPENNSPADYANSIKTISGLVPTRIGGPQVPAPVVV